MSGKINSSKNYFIITPCKNEGLNLPSLINSIVDQTIKPIVWLIIDDGSSDNTPEIIKDAKEKYGWIQSIRLDERARDLGLHLSNVIKMGFDHAISYCEGKKMDYDFMGNVDGDLILKQTFFEHLIKEFNNNSQLGVASGGTINIISGKLIHAKISINEPSGGHILIRKECYQQCSGIPISYAWDTVLKAKARIKGWDTKRFEDNIVTEIRDVNSVEGYWKGYVVSGKKDHFLNLNPLHAIFKSIKYSLRNPYYIGVVYLWSYFKNIINREKQINDEEIRRYFWNKWRESLTLQFINIRSKRIIS